MEAKKRKYPMQKVFSNFDAERMRGLHMDKDRFAITEEGQVYRLRGRDRPLLLGHISCLVHEKTRLGHEVRGWWQVRLASEEPGENIVLTRSGEFCFVRSGEATVVEGPSQEVAVTPMAAD
jgi:hypothetical protein